MIPLLAIGVGVRHELSDSELVDAVQAQVVRGRGVLQFQGQIGVGAFSDGPPALQRTLAILSREVGDGGPSPVDWSRDRLTLGAAAVLALGPDHGPRALLIGGGEARWVEVRSVAWDAPSWRVGRPTHGVAAGPVLGAGMSLDPTSWSEVRFAVIERIDALSLQADPIMSLDLLVRPGERR